MFPNGLPLAAQGISDYRELALAHQVWRGVATSAKCKKPLDNVQRYPLAAGSVLGPDRAVAHRSVVMNTGLKKLLKLKDWLTVPDAARHLSILFGDDVSEADVLRLALDGRLTLSVRLVNRMTARPGKIIPPADAKIVVVEDVFGNTYQRIEEGVDLGNDRMLTFSRDVSFIEGIWDLSMLGTERVIVEKRYQFLTSGPTVELTLERPLGQSSRWRVVANSSPSLQGPVSQKPLQIALW